MDEPTPNVELTVNARAALAALTDLGQAEAVEVRDRIGKSRAVTDKALKELADGGLIVAVEPGPDEPDGTPTRWRPATATTGDASAEQSDVDDNPPTDAEAGPDGDVTVSTATVEGQPQPRASRPADRKVLIVAGVLGDYPDGTTLDVIAAACGLGELTVARLLAAMEPADAARRVPGDRESGTPELWKPGEGKASQVDPNPPAPRCHACGQVIRPVRAASASATAGRVSSTVNSDGSEPFGRNELRGLVLDHINANPGVVFTPQRIADALSAQLGRVVSGGAVRNNCTTLAAAGMVGLASETPLAFVATSREPAQG